MFYVVNKNGSFSGTMYDSITNNIIQYHNKLDQIVIKYVGKLEYSETKFGENGEVIEESRITTSLKNVQDYEVRRVEEFVIEDYVLELEERLCLMEIGVTL